MTHLRNALAVWLSIAVTSIVFALGDPAVQHVLQHHTQVIAALAAVAAVVHALARALTGNTSPG